MKKVLFFTGRSSIADSFKELLSHEDIFVSTSSYKDLNLLIDGENTSIKIRQTGEDLSEFDAIICLSAPDHSLISAFNIYSSIGCYCRKKQIKMIDDTFTNTSGKLYEMWRFWEKDLPVPKTAFGDVDFLAEKLEDFGGVAVLKSTGGTKGKDNYLVHTKDEIAAVLNDETPFILQNFIENDGDYRVVAFDYEPKLAIYRSSGGSDHRNNTSLGGHADVVEMSPEISDLAKKAAMALDIKFAGVDIITDKNTGENYLLEINRTPQFVSGAFIEEKYKALKDYLLSI